MIGKITKGKSFSGCIKYILDKEKGTKLLDAQGVRLKSKESIIQSFVMQAKLRPALAKSVGHIALSFSAEDKAKLTDELIVKVAREYLQKMGVKDTQYIVARHFDKEHPHIHICFNRIDNQGKTISDKNDRHRSVKVCRELTEKHGLYIASGKEQVKTHRLKEPDKTKYEVYNTIKVTLPKCKNWEDLTSALQKQGVDTQFKCKGHTNEKQGVIFSKGEYSFNGSKVDRQFSYSKIDYQLKKNSQEQKNTISQSPSMDYSLESVASLATMEQHGEDFDEIAFANRMDYEEKERQRKKKRGLRF
jgi:hypothetical protein